jgi:transposase
MPSITKAEYERLKKAEEGYLHFCRDNRTLFINNQRLMKELELFQNRLKTSEECRNNIHQSRQDETRFLELKLSNEKLINESLLKAIRNQQHEVEKWKRFYDAVRETFKVDEIVEIPGCFSLTDSVKFILLKQ